MEPISVEFPLRGEWISPNTPGHKVPSHGTDQMAQTYAYDLMQIDWHYPKGYRYYNKSSISALLFGIRLKNCLGWSQPIYAPFSGEVIEAYDGITERDPVFFVRDVTIALKNGIFFEPSNINKEMQKYIGNYIVLKGDDCYAFFAHARNGSISVKPGDVVTVGQIIAEVGHSGNSTAPHLHFHLMDAPSLMTAKGIPCCFKKYEVYKNDQWEKVTNGMPDRYDRIRVI